MKKEEIRRHPEYVLTTLSGCFFLFRDQRTEDTLFIYLNVMFPYMKKIILKENGSLSFSTLKRTAHKQGLQCYIQNDCDISD